MRAAIIACAAPVVCVALACMGPQGVEPVCTVPIDITCVDEAILDLGLQTDVSGGAVTNTTEGDDFVTDIDATAGGYQQASTSPWVYLRFTETGAEKVEIDDESALESMEWHLAARRYVLRLNGGSSGPSCIGAAPFLERDYGDLTEVPEGTVFREDDYYTSDCTIINDSSGLPGSPQVALGAWWEYPGCVATTSHPFLVQLEDGRVLRMVMERYYEEGQDTCNESGAPGEGSAMLRMRWAFL